MLDNASEKKSPPSELETYPGETADQNNPAKNGAVAVARAYAEPPRFVAPTHSGVDILKLLTELEDLVEGTKRLPMRTLVGFDEEQFHMTILKIRANLPEEMKRASKLARESDRIVEEARASADQLIQDAHAAALADLEQGRAEAHRMKEQAGAEAHRLKEQAAVEARRLEEQAAAEAANTRRLAEQEAQRVRAKAHQEAEAILEEARVQAARLVADSEIVRQAQTRAQDLLSRSEQEAAAMRAGAEEYARDLLNHLENVMGKAIAQIQRGRDTLAEQSGGSGSSI